MAHMPDLREQQWLTVILSPISISNAIVTVSDTFGLHPKAAISLSLGAAQGDFEIKRVLSDTQIEIGNVGTGIKGPFLSPTQFNGGMLTMSEQNRNKFGSELVLRAVYQEEPALALRTMQVDPYGEAISSKNPLPVSFDGTISIGDVSIVQGGNTMAVNVDGSINTNLEGLTTFQTSQYTVGTTAVQITPTPMVGRSSIGFKAVTTTYADAIYVGNSAAVTVLTGYPLFNKDTLQMDLDAGEPIYAIATSAGQMLYVVELGD
jgi:hypothetical protein